MRATSAPRALRALLVTSALALPCPAALTAQGTAADFARAEGLRDRFRGLVVDAVDQTGWIDSTPRLWYRKSTRTGHEFVVADADARQKRPAFDHPRLAAALAPLLRRPVRADSLPIATLSFTDGERTLTVRADTARVRCTLADYVCVAQPPAPEDWRDPAAVGGGWYGQRRAADSTPRLSPDRRWEALVRNHNVYVRPAFGAAGGAASDEGTVLSTDGIEGDAYALASLTWSPDSRRLAAYRVRPGLRRELHYVQSSPEDQLQPRHHVRPYSKPGDVLDQARPVIFDVAARRQTAVDDALFPNAFDVTPLVWRADGRALTFEYNERGHQLYRVVEVDAATGRARAVIEERVPTFFHYSAKKYRHDLRGGREVVWMSERDGWNHLYLMDGATGQVKRQITRGRWVVRGVDHVDTTARQIWFSASGMEPGTDPYNVHHYRVGIDGGEVTRLTSADAMHGVVYSTDRRYYVDVWSRVDLPPVAELRSAADRSLVMPLETADASALLAAGWRPPEVFVAKGRDGRTDIWGVIVRPMRLDPARRYPVVENIYAGPHGSFVPKTFSSLTGMQAIAELGFVVVQIDGMGTSNRGKAFHDVAWRNLKDAGFPDRILWHRAAAAKHAYYDASRVGIYGTSAGGQSAMAALLFHPDFYKVAVAAAGSHDNRMDKIWWNEQWMGWPIGPHYAASSNVDNAHLLQGKLLLLVGEMDRNVDPSTTFQVANALIKAKKTFDLVVIPGADHTSGGDYGDRRRWDFLVHSLLGVEPPDRNAPAPVPAGGSR